jgi:2-haloalkanoic acid dehalogenase type II
LSLIAGTVVDWRKSVIDCLCTLPQAGKQFDPEAFALEWRHGYYLATPECSTVPDPSNLQTIDEIHFAILKRLIAKYELESVWSESLLQDINLIWHRLQGWPDSSEGLRLLKKKYIIGTLSNGNARLLVDMAKFSDLPWDVLFSGDLLKAYKPNERMYLGACEYLQLPPEKVGMVFPVETVADGYIGRRPSGRSESCQEVWIEDRLHQTTAGRSGCSCRRP